MKYIVNFGAGVNSTAMIIEMVKRKMPIDYVIFSDTGSELPETYEFLAIMEIWLHNNNIPFVQVKSKYGCSVYDYYHQKKMTPSRKFRDCTDKFKKSPITKFLKQFKSEGVTQYIGIASDEARRCRVSDTKWITFEYPLVKWMMTRPKCIDIIKAEGLPEPIKSGCFMCPFQSDKAWLSLSNTHPKLWRMAKMMEQDGKNYPKITLRWSGTLAQLELAKKEQTSLKEYESDNHCDPKRSCDGFCMT